MANLKQKGHEGVGEITEQSGQLSDLGREMQEQTGEIKQKLDEIQVADSEDVQAVEIANEGYQDSFDSAFAERVESPAERLEERGTSLVDEMSAERERVGEGIRKARDAANVSDIGRGAGDALAGKLEASSAEYGEIVSDAQSVVSDMQQKTQNFKAAISSAFRK